MTIKDRLESVEARINDAVRKSGRSREEVTLVAVTKTYPVEDMNEAIALGVTDVGENKPQEVRDKFDKVSPVRWHLIGHLQSNKVKYVIDRCSLIHSVDSVKLMEEIERQAVARQRDIDILIQVNISGEESKSGIPPHQLTELLDYAQSLSRVHVKGLMTIAPIGDHDEVAVHFKNMKELFDETKKATYKNVEMKELSMGMSGDFETAIEYGATIVRIGSLIFGPRNYN